MANLSGNRSVREEIDERKYDHKDYDDDYYDGTYDQGFYGTTFCANSAGNPNCTVYPTTRLDHLNDVDIVEKKTSNWRFGKACGMNRKSREVVKKNRDTCEERRYFDQAQRCHGGTDNRRRRKGDGKMIGGHHKRQCYWEATIVSQLVPVEVVLDSGRCLRIR